MLHANILYKNTFMYLHTTILNLSLQKASCGHPPTKDSLLVYDFEGQDSPVGSMGCCSLLESENDLEFLNNLGPKFMTLAEICIPPRPSPPPHKIEQIIKSVDTTIKSESSVTTSTVQISESVAPPPQPPPPAQQSSVTSVTKTINQSSDISMMNTSQTFLVQQKPLYYLVEQQVPSTMILAERSAHGTYLINGPTGNNGLILQGGKIAQDTLEQQGMYLIDGASMLQGNMMLGNCTNSTSAGSLTLPTVLFQGGKKVLQGTLPRVSPPGDSDKGTGEKSE